MLPKSAYDYLGQRWRAALDLITTLAMLTVAAIVITGRLSPSASPASFSLPKESISLDGAMILGDRSAKIGIVEFSDFECPFCRRFAKEVLPEVNNQLLKTGRAFLAFRHLPLPMHQFARKAAETVECARRQGKFLEAHDALFDQVAPLSPDLQGRLATTVGIDRVRFESCLAGEALGLVNKDIAQAQKLGISSTPFFLVGTREPNGTLRVHSVIRGAMSLEQFENAVQAATDKR